MRNLSKSKLLAFRQCPKRLWLEIHDKDLRQDSAATETSFKVGELVGEKAQKLYDPAKKGEVIDRKELGYTAALARSSELLASAQPIFEAGFSAEGALAFADVLLPTRQGGKKVWKMIEVKSSTSVKDYHRDDVAIQACIARSAGVPLVSVVLAYIDNAFVYPGGDDYKGLLKEEDLTEQAFARTDEVKGWIADAQKVASKRTEPKIGTGPHCTDPYECGFMEHCQSQEPQAEYPVAWLPRIQTKALKALIEEEGVTDLRDIPDKVLNEEQLRVKKYSLSGKTWFNKKQAAADLAAHPLPAYFIDFETTQFAVPIWKGTRPYQQLPFQFSVHCLSRSGQLTHQSFLDLSGNDPLEIFAESLIAACGKHGPVFVYNQAFEKTRIKELAERFPHLQPALLGLNERVVDLLPMAKKHYYHPSQQGSWSIKKLLPAVAPDLSYDALDGVHDGGMAMEAFHTALLPKTSKAEKMQIEQQLLDYCRLDTYAMVRLWQFFSNRNDLEI
jgi:CRISPR/Cas system-associated exonuclease Cas4 (RecB family)